MEKNMEVPQKIKNRATIISSNSTSQYISKRNKNHYIEVICPYMFIAALFTVVKIWK